MKRSRTFLTLAALAVGLGFLASSAQARSSRNNRNDQSNGSRRLVDRDWEEGDNNKRDEEKRKQEEEKKRKDEAKKKADEAKKNTPAPSAPKPSQPKVTTVQKPAPTKIATKPGKPGTGQKTDEALEQEAAKLREKADAALGKGELLPCVKLYRQVLEEYDGTEAAKAAQQQLDLLLGTEPYGPMILAADADELFGAQRYRRAQNKYRELVQRFPTSEQATAARARLAEIVEKDLLSKSVYTEEELEDARLWFLAANIHLENGRRTEAASAYRKVIEDYPGCRFAAMAQERLPQAREL